MNAKLIRNGIIGASLMLLLIAALVFPKSFSVVVGLLNFAFLFAPVSRLK